MERERALADLISLEMKLVKEANSAKGESKKTMREYDKAVSHVCKMFELNEETFRNMIN